MKKIILILITFFAISDTKAQTNKEATGWFFWLNNQKLSKNWSIHFDGQFRSANEFDYLRTTIIRPGITYKLSQSTDATLGYALILTNYQNLPANAYKPDPEHRIWEQIFYKLPLSKKLILNNRFRLEQRFINTSSNTALFSQRFRYFARVIIPLRKVENKFNKGWFAGLQNEVFVNLQNKSRLNNSFFDQNRAYASLGYRLNSKIDIDAGYLSQTVKGLNSNTQNNVIQLGLYTKF